jgi:methionine-rich copper-binding protein CopC
MKSSVSSPSRLRSRSISRSGSSALLAILAAALMASPLIAALHIGLASSVPAKDAHVMTAPTEIRLTFTGPIDVAKAGIEFVGPDSGQVSTSPLRAVPDSARVAVAKITGRLAGGTYTVKWKAVAADGAPGSGSFTFMYMASSEDAEGTVSRKQ